MIALTSDNNVKWKGPCDTHFSVDNVASVRAMLTATIIDRLIEKMTAIRYDRFNAQLLRKTVNARRRIN